MNKYKCKTCRYTWDTNTYSVKCPKCRSIKIIRTEEKKDASSDD